MVHSCCRCDSPASVHLTEIKGGKKTEQHFCEKCADHLQLPQPAKELQKLIQSYNPSAPLADRGTASEAACPECGMTYEEFRQSGRFGCANDYHVFGQELIRLLDRIHGSSRHTGTGPGGRVVQGGEVVDELSRLRARLRDAVDEEDYEEAARLRDEIRQLSSGDDSASESG